MKRIYKLFTLVMLFVLCLGMVSCNKTKKEKVTLVVPSGTPTLGIASALDAHNDEIEYEIVLGSDALIAGFTNSSYDIIVAPVNLGAKFYQSLNNYNYAFYQTIVGGCFYLVSTEKLNDITELNGQEVTVFGATSTPGIIYRSLIQHYNVDVKTNYINDVTEANATLISGKAKTIVSAQPSISKFNANGKYYTLDLQAEWKKMAGSEYAIPQAGIFVKKDKLEKANVKKVLSYLSNSIALANSDPKKLAESAVNVDQTLAKIGSETLVKAIPNCHFINDKYNKAEIEFYFNKLIELGLGNTIGGKLPDEDFYA